MAGLHKGVYSCSRVQIPNDSVEQLGRKTLHRCNHYAQGVWIGFGGQIFLVSSNGYEKLCTVILQLLRR
jgi:hypothetical protein